MTEITDQKVIDLVQSIKEACADAVNDKDLAKILKGNKTAAVRFRQKTHAITKLFKEFRQATVAAGLVYTNKKGDKAEAEAA